MPNTINKKGCQLLVDTETWECFGRSKVKEFQHPSRDVSIEQSVVMF